MKKIYRLIIGATLVIGASQVFAQGSAPAAGAKKRYAASGTVELAGTISFASSTTTSSTSTSSSTVNQFGFSPTISVFPVNYFFLGVTGAYITQYQSSFNVNQLGAYASPGFAFDIGNAFFPYVSGLFGFGSQSTSIGSASATASGVGYGGRAGLKISIVEGALLDFGFQYLAQNYSQSGSSATLTVGTFSVLAGFSVWF